MVTDGLLLSKLRLRAIFSSVLKKSTPPADEVVDPLDLRCLLVADMLEKMNLTVDQRMLILTVLQPGISSTNMMALADGRWLTWTGQKGFTDIFSGDDVMELKHPPMETIGYNLTELYRRGVQMLERRNGFHVKKSDADSVDEPGDVLDSPADSLS